MKSSKNQRFASTQLRPRKSSFWAIALFAALALIALGIILQSTPAEGMGGTVATYTHGRVNLTIPYHAGMTGMGQLRLEILDPEDHVVAETSRDTRVDEGDGRWHADLQLAKMMPIEDLVWHRLRYRFEFDHPAEHAGTPIEGTESISQILRTPVIHILGQQSYLTGSQAAVRVINTDSKNEILSGGNLKIELIESEKLSRLLFKGPLDRRGTTEAQFRLPAGLVGSYQLRYSVDTSIGSTEFTQSLRLEDKQSILLTTEKPIYQPGQTIHVRALVLDRADHHAANSRKLTFEVEDSRGNKVFKKLTATDEFGIASAEFTLADEVNLGTYHLRALLGDSEAAGSSSAEMALNVQRYVLPKFKVAVEFSGDHGKATHGYRPGDHVTGTVHANYFFGKAVDGGEVTIKATALDVALFEAGSVQGKTDRDGTYHFDFRLPSYFAGRPLEQGAAKVLVEASVKDSAGHTEARGEPITVTESPIIVTAVPEGGTLVRNIENEVFILTSYPDGSPAKTDLTVHGSGLAEQHVSSDAGGVAVVRMTPGDTAAQLEIEAHDSDGNRAKRKVQLESRDGQDQVLLRVERAVYHAGDPIHLKIFSTHRRGTVYVDVVKEGQTVLTRDLDIENGVAELNLTASPDLAGTVDLNAYQFSRNAVPVGDHRLIFVQPAEELKIETVADAGVYRPGQDARIRFRVTNARGQGVRAALGLQVVDEAVFALAEKQPGFAKVFFYLEQEVLKPRYEIHSIGMPEVVEPVEKSEVEQKDRAARALFAATEVVNTNKMQTEFGRTIPSTKYAEYANRYRTEFMKQAHDLAKTFNNFCLDHPNAGDLGTVARQMGIEGEVNLRDAWGGAMHFQPAGWNDGQKTYIMLVSNGPDKQAGTGDDLGVYFETRRRRIVGPARAVDKSTIHVDAEQGFGPFTSSGLMAGTIIDRTGAALPGALITVRAVTNGIARTVRSNARGYFTLRGLPEDTYTVNISMPGFDGVSAQGLNLHARDMFNLSVTLRGEAAETIVAVNESYGVFPGAIAEEVIAKDMAVDRVRGMALGAMGGVRREAQAPMAAADFRQKVRDEEKKDMATAAPRSSAVLSKENDSAAPRVRSYFPEALYINPEIITDGDGRASIVIPLADSITTWRMAMMASTANGALGSSTSSLKVFQDFFVDLDLPVTLTQGDSVSIPVAVYNYSGAAGDVSLTLKPEGWYDLTDDRADKSVSVEAGRVGGSQFSIVARRIGKFKLTLSARMNGNARRADIVVREIEVVPNGREQNLVYNDRLENILRQEVSFPPNAIPDASKIFIKLYPGPLSQVIEGMDSILRMPGGCFEQTSSSTYPNVLALDYMKRTKKLTPEVHAKAEGFIANGYQRLLTFEVPGGGFSWFGNPPANKILTAYGLMEFYDMSKVYDVDPNLITRTQAWLAGQQQADGSWKPDTQFINEGATNRYNSDVLRITAYIAWSLENSGYQGPAVERAKKFIEDHLQAKTDSYTLAVLANFAVDYGKDREFTRAMLGRLLDARVEQGDDVSWNADETAVYSTGASASVETTGLAVQALLKWGEASNVARKALHFITTKKDASGNWGTTQATIMALRALLLATEKGGADVRGTVDIAINGKPAGHLVLNQENNDLLHQFVFKDIDQKGLNTLELKFEGKGGLAYQLVGQYFLPWDQKPQGEPLSINVDYDRTTLSQDDISTATVTVKNNLRKVANMVMVDVGIPPGFDLLSEDLDDYREQRAKLKSGRMEKFSLTATQAILYFDSFAPGDKVTFKYRLRAKYPIRAKTFSSRVYEYYSPDVQSVARPIQMEVKGK
jgi:A-macroglobulin TED domain/Alpha-2-macroglobulin family/MG2 domain/Carboxypeptidase regulatory-like domain/A-macroglobulin receptor binding domain/Alpha-2-macroglobulin bait region domain/Macroglobulin domain MG3